jgi:hypothetical protein
MSDLFNKSINKNYPKERNVNVTFVKVLKLSETFYGGTLLIATNVIAMMWAHGVTRRD